MAFAAVSLHRAACFRPCANTPTYKPSIAHARTSVVQNASKDLSGLKSALSGSVDSAYQEGSAFLKSLGLKNPAEIARILDIAMNPNSLFVSYKDRQRSGAARRLSVEDDMRPIVNYFIDDIGLSKAQVVSIISGHPPTLGYSVPNRVAPFVSYLREVGIDDVAAVIADRPSLLGLDIANIKEIVRYLLSTNISKEKVTEYLRTTI